MKREKTVQILAYCSSVIIFLLVWGVYSKALQAPLVLPSPVFVFSSVLPLLKTSFFWISFLYTFLRILVTFCISIFSGCIIGFLCSVSKFVKYFFEFPLTVISSTPVAAVILISMFWFKSNTLPVFVAVLMTLPVMTSNIINGLSKENSKMLFMADLYGYTIWEKYRYIILPECKSDFLSALETVFGLCWKVVVAGEVLCLPKYSVGSLLQDYQIQLETSKTLGTTFILVVFCFLMQKIFTVLIKECRKSEN